MRWTATGTAGPTGIPVAPLPSGGQFAVPGHIRGGLPGQVETMDLYSFVNGGGLYLLQQAGWVDNGLSPVYAMPSQIDTGTTFSGLYPDMNPGDTPALFATDTNNDLWMYAPSGELPTPDPDGAYLTGQWSGGQVLA
jgi:hypothetical protein